MTVRVYHFVAKIRNQSVISPFSEQPWNQPRQLDGSMRGPTYQPLNVSDDAKNCVDQRQIRSVQQSRPAIHYGEGPFSPPSSDDEDDYTKDVDNDQDSIIRFEIGNGDDEEELLVGGRRRPASPLQLKWL